MTDGLRWRGGSGFRYEEKLDGCWRVEELPQATVCGELMRDDRFYAFDILSLYGQDLRPLPLCERLAALDTLGLQRPAAGHGGEFLEAVLSRGGEGIVAKNLAAPWGDAWAKCKRSQVFYCRVTDLDQWTGGVHLADRDTGEKRGKMPLRGGKFERVQVGSILKVEAYGLTKNGLLREARPDKDAADSWLVSFSRSAISL
jgi:hypothetical protein